ncbi:MAG: hypothetical protein KJ645_08360, partial [Planctomycetes bacterium]|nr:hypothetical protein [Planctomycetota bacterium]
MLSDFRDDDSPFAFSLGYGNTGSGDSTYNTVALGLRWRPVGWLQVTTSIPYSFVDGDDLQVVHLRDPVDDTPYTETERFKYDEEGIGDITIMGWVNLLYPFMDEVTPEERAVQDPEEVDTDDIGDPFIFLGAGVKLPTGEYEA